MALFPEWLRPVRRDNFSDNPILAIEKLISLPRPLEEADKEILVGAALTLSASLTLALGMLQELLPQETSRERLGEVVCPTLGQLLASLNNTLPLFEGDIPTATPPANTPRPTTPRHVSGNLKDVHLSPRSSQRTTTGKDQSSAPARPLIDRPTSSSTVKTHSPRARTKTERFPPLEDNSAVRHVDGVDIQSRPETHLMKALQAEMRVQAAIHVAIESLEFAEGQLKVIKVGGDFDLLQKHFYEGYNRLLFRALELQRQELGLLPGREILISPTPNGHSSMQTTPRLHPTVSFQDTLPVQPPTASPRVNGMISPAYLERRPLGRRNTIHGVRQENSRSLVTKPALKRRLSLADELSLAMVGEDSESGYHDETSEMASSASELEQSEVEESEYSANGESAGEESAFDSGDNEDSEDRTLDAFHPTTNRSRPGSRLPRYQQPQRREHAEVAC